MLLHCAQLQPDARSRERLSELAGLVDWGRLLPLGARHGLLPLMQRHLASLPPTLLRRQARIQLWAHYEMSRRQFQLMAAELVELMALLEAEGIRAVSYKGPVLAVALYGDPALREFGDLDILMDPTQLLAAKQLLLRRGYRVEHELTPALEAAYLRSSRHYHLVMVHPVTAIMVELHWKTDAQFPVGAPCDDEWWSRLSMVSLPNGALRTIPDRDMLLLLCLHGSKHHWGALGWMVDIVELGRRLSDPDWQVVMDAAEAFRARRRVALGLSVVSRLLGMPLPPDVAAWVAATPAVAELAEDVGRQLLLPPYADLTPLGRLRFELRTCDTFRQRLRQVDITIFSATLAEWVRWPLPRWLWFLYPPVRLCKLGLRYALRAIRGPGSPA